MIYCLTILPILYYFDYFIDNYFYNLISYFVYVSFNYYFYDSLFSLICVDLNPSSLCEVFLFLYVFGFILNLMDCDYFRVYDI